MHKKGSPGHVYAHALPRSYLGFVHQSRLPTEGVSVSFSPRRDTNAVIGNFPKVTEDIALCSGVAHQPSHFPHCHFLCSASLFILSKIFFVVFRVAHISLTAPTSPVNKRRCGEVSRNE